MEKKKFKETKLGALLLHKIPKAAGIIGEALPDKGVLGIVKNIIQGSSDLTTEERQTLLKLHNDFEIEMYQLEVRDRESARTREIELAKTGKTDHLMYVAGYTALLTFILMVVSVIFLSNQVSDNALFHQLMGIIEGVALTVFGYYFGTSKSSSDKNKMFQNKT
ncbi:MAG: hypothetical protein WBO32_02510 [Cyclobacteriaceae bacterium]